MKIDINPDDLLPGCPDALIAPLANWQVWLRMLDDPAPKRPDTCLSLEKGYASHPSRWQWEGREPRTECDWREGERMHIILGGLDSGPRLCLWRRHTVEAWQTVTAQDIRKYLRHVNARPTDIAQSLDAGYARIAAQW